MAEDIGLEPLIEDEPLDKSSQKQKKAQLKFLTKVETTKCEEETEENNEPKELTRSAKKKLKKRLAKQKRELAERNDEEPDAKKSKEEPKDVTAENIIPKKTEEQENKKSKNKKKDPENSFESIEKKFTSLLSELAENTSKFKEGEEIIKKEIENGKITPEQAETLYRVYNRNLRLMRHRALIVKILGEDASLDDIKRKVTELVGLKKITPADAGVLIKRWKAKEHRRIDRQIEKIKKSFCFHCRESGHKAAECPQKSSVEGDGICFKCGSTEHTIYSCKRKGVKGFPFATCFICKQTGHLSRDCHQNQNGVYPDGGSCNVCGAVTHLKKDCPELAAQKAGSKQEKKIIARSIGDANTTSADMDYDPSEALEDKPKVIKKKKKSVKF